MLHCVWLVAGFLNSGIYLCNGYVMLMLVCVYMFQIESGLSYLLEVYV